MIFPEAFNEVWHLVLHYKLRQNSISGKYLNSLTYFLDNRTQSAIFTLSLFLWTKVEAGIFEGSILRLVSFLIYITDLSKNSASNPEPSLFSVVENIDASVIK